MCSFSTYFQHILILHNSQLTTTNWVKGRRMQLTNDKTCCATTLRQMLRCAQTTNVICVARLSDMLNDPYCPPCVCSTRMACPEILCAPDFVHPHKHQHLPVLLPTDVWHHGLGLVSHCIYSNDYNSPSGDVLLRTCAPQSPSNHFLIRNCFIFCLGLDICLSLLWFIVLYLYVEESVFYCPRAAREWSW